MVGATAPGPAGEEAARAVAVREVAAAASWEAGFAAAGLVAAAGVPCPAGEEAAKAVVAREAAREARRAEAGTGAVPGVGEWVHQPGGTADSSAEAAAGWEAAVKAAETGQRGRSGHSPW